MRKIGGLLFSLSLIGFFHPLNASGAEETIQAQVVIESGGLHISSLSEEIDFGTITIDGSTVVKKAALDQVFIEDFTGSANGWNVNVRATPFSNGTTVFPENSLVLYAAIALQAEGTSSTKPSVFPADAYPLDNHAGVKLVSAEKEQGMGRFSIAFPKEALQLFVETDTIQTDQFRYSSIITWSVVTGP